MPKLPIHLTIFAFMCCLLNAFGQGPTFASYTAISDPAVQADYLTGVISLMPPPKSKNADYQPALTLAAAWALSERPALVKAIGDSLQSERETVGVLLNALVRVTFDQPQEVLAVVEALPEKAQAKYLYDVMQTRLRYGLKTPDTDLLPVYFQYNLAEYYLRRHPQPDFYAYEKLLSKAELEDWDRKQQMRHLLDRWLYLDSESLIQYLKSKPETACQHSDLFQDWASKDAHAAIAASTQLTGVCEGSGNSPLGKAINGWYQTDPTATEAWSLSVDEPTLQPLVIQALSHASANADGRLAAQLFNQVQDLGARAELAPKIARALADSDPALGLQWIRDNQNAMDMREPTKAFYKHVAKYDLEFAIEQYPHDLPVNLQQVTVQAIMSHAAQANPEVMFEWLAALPPITTRDYNFTRLADMIIISPDAVTHYLENHPDSKTHHRPYMRVAQKWASEDPEAAIAWAKTITAGGPEYGSAYGVTTGLLEINDDMAVEWIVELPPGHRRNSAILAMIDKRLKQRPQLTFELIATMTHDDKRRAENLEKAAKLSLKRNPQNGAALLSTPNLYDADRAMIQNLLKQ
ncbi:hypothetical protein [Cerasicoccus maritimus]|uniref:hypothetical protein n=1 Tax=Cerasicoccus maritimus TaxID=490089 RepID=UPI002852CEB1|nr:hypothetical protein [Cerasicoccus maritimus]